MRNTKSVRYLKTIKRITTFHFYRVQKQLNYLVRDIVRGSKLWRKARNDNYKIYQKFWVRNQNFIGKRDTVQGTEASRILTAPCGKG